MKLDDVLHIDTTAKHTLSVKGEDTELTLYELARWAALMKGIDTIEMRAQQLKIDLSKDKFWVKPLALQKYIDEETPAMVTEIVNLDENGDIDPL
tara:strand:+ start:397 stop:681 length:285 start_codon:yes stop_codon:yes gene_type:complete